MDSNPLTDFGLLLRACVGDDEDSESLLTVTAISFTLGLAASMTTAYLLGLAHLIV